jgi:LacI family transcriptional regulator, gluconate utilization system Gnt-I transcriptional repressor
MTVQGAQPRRTRRGSGAVTLHDVARLAGVAPITASRALNSPDQVSDEVRKKVQDAIVRTGYVPNRLAGGLASTRSKLVAAVFPTLSGMVFLRTMQALDETLAARGYQLMVGQSGYANNREDALLEAIIGRRPDGIVLTGIVHSVEGRRRLIASGIPIVETWDLTPTPMDMLVGFSHAEVGRKVAQFLHSKGRRHLAIVLGDDERASRRLEAYKRTAQELGLPNVEVEVAPSPTTMRSGREALGRILARSPRVDAVFCSSDLLALGVLTEAHARGLEVPGKLAIVGFGDLELSADVHPSLTTVQINGDAIGRQAARFLLDRLDGQSVDPRVIDIGFSIIEREST